MCANQTRKMDRKRYTKPSADLSYRGALAIDIHRCMRVFLMDYAWIRCTVDFACNMFPTKCSQIFPCRIFCMHIKQSKLNSEISVK